MKKTWEGINNLLNRKKGKSKQVTAIQDSKNDNKVTRDSSRISNIFNEHFASVGPKLAHKLPQSEKHYLDFITQSKSPDTSFYFEAITSAEVKLEILTIPNNKSHGLYSCPTKILKCVSDNMGDILAEIFNRSVASGVYPSKLKLAKIIPIFKSDDETDANNCRPIYLLSIISTGYLKKCYTKE